MAIVSWDAPEATRSVAPAKIFSPAHRNDKRQLSQKQGRAHLSATNISTAGRCAIRPLAQPQATTVGYVNEGLTLYFLCGSDSQKAANLARDDRVSLTIDHDTPQVMEITGLSMAARAQPVFDQAEASKVLRYVPLKYPEQVDLPLPMPTPDDVRIFRVTPMIISVLDYSKGFGHRDLVTC